MDPLTQLVELLRPRTLLWKHMVGKGNWAWRFPAERGVVFGRVVSGHCRFQLPGTMEQSMSPGDYMLLTAPPAWILRGGDDAAVVDLENALADITSPEPGGAQIQTRFASSAAISNSTPSIQNFS
jgi:hypothetical protein